MQARNLIVGPVSLALGLLALAGLLLWQQARLELRVADAHLETARKVQVLVEQQFQRDLDARARLIASNQSFIGYITQAMGGILPGTAVDTASIVDLLEERRSQLGLTIAAVVDGQGQLLASRDHISDRRDFAHDPLFAQVVTSNAVTHGLWVEGDKVFFISLLPLDAYGSDAGFLLVGMPLDDAVAKVIGDTAKGEAALYAITAQGPLLAASTDKVGEGAATPAALKQELMAGEHRFALRLHGAAYRGYVAPLFGSDAGRVVLMVKTNNDFASAVLLGLPLTVGATLGLLWFWLAMLLRRRRITQQVDVLAGLMERAAATGDYHLQAGEAYRDAGPLVPLASAFNQLMARLGRTASRERKPPA